MKDSWICILKELRFSNFETDFVFHHDLVATELSEIDHIQLAVGTNFKSNVIGLKLKTEDLKSKIDSMKAIQVAYMKSIDATIQQEVRLMLVSESADAVVTEPSILQVAASHLVYPLECGTVVCEYCSIFRCRTLQHYWLTFVIDAKWEGFGLKYNWSCAGHT